MRISFSRRIFACVTASRNPAEYLVALIEVVVLPKTGAGRGVAVQDPAVEEHHRAGVQNAQL